MKKPEVTIVVPIYNVEKYIEKCLQSLTKQTFKEIEILAVSDGSPDNSSKIVEKYKELDNRIKLIEKENGGYGSVLEYVINNIKTEYFIVCDPDDWMEDNCVEILYNKAKENNLDIMMANKFLAYNDGEIEKDKFYNEFYELKSNKVYSKEIERFSFMPPSPHAKLYKTEILKNVKFPYKVSYTDFILYLMALKNAKRVLYINEPLVYYLLDRPGNTRTDRKPKAIKDHLVVWNSVFQQITSNDKYLIYRLYKELKYITRVYYRNSEQLFKDDIFQDILEAISLLKPYYKEIKNNFTKKLVNKIEIFLIFKSQKTLKLFIKIRKLLNK